MHYIQFISPLPPQGVKGSGEVDPERAGGQVFPSLVALLKSSSPHFSTTIGNQVRREGEETMATAHIQHCHSGIISSSLKEHMFAEETDVGGGGEEGQEAAVEVPLHDISDSAEQRTPQSGSKRPDTQPK